MKLNIKNILAAVCLMMIFTGCKKLSLQKDYDRDPKPLDPKLHKTAGQYLKDRATGVAKANDTLFVWMLRGIQYAEIDLAEYDKPGRTFVLLHNDAIRRVTQVNKKDSTQPDCFFGVNFVNGKPAQKWEDYPKDFVKNYLLYLITNKVLDHYTMLVPDDNYEVATLAPEGSFDELPGGITRHKAFPFMANQKSMIRFKVLNSSPTNTSDYPIVLNDARNVRTSSLQADNGSVHVIDRFLPPNLPEE